MAIAVSRKQRVKHVQKHARMYIVASKLQDFSFHEILQISLSSLATIIHGKPVFYF